jgi:hypothetical protein
MSQRKMIVLRAKEDQERGMAFTEIDSLRALFAAAVR